MSNKQAEGMSTTDIKEWCAAVSQDLEQIAVLHDREADKPLITALREIDFPYNLGMPVVSREPGVDPFSLMKKTLIALPRQIESSTLDQLASDYADIYLTHSIHASPYESVWLDEDHLMQQEPMFQVRQWYERYGLASEDWRIRSDDHLVLQLQFIAFLLNPHLDESSMGESYSLQKRIEDATLFMDEHLLLWLHDFSQLVMQRCATDFYASVSFLTLTYIDQLRDELALITGIDRLTAEEIKQKLTAQPVVEEPVRFMPGVAESW